MKKRILLSISSISCLFGCSSVTMAATHYVDLTSPSPTPPYSSWITAATNIQDAVDAAMGGETVVINNGHYLLSSEIVVTNDITIESVNGPNSTIVDGQGAVRCFNLGHAACIVSGLTITDGFGGYGGGIFCLDGTPVVTNCIISGNNALIGGGMYWGAANNCTISGNLADEGGAMYYGIANNCAITGNSASYGGGLVLSTANNCTISSNTASGDLGSSGAGMVGGTANNCVISGNSASSGGGGGMVVGRGAGGTVEGTANNCTISSNTAA